MFGLLICHLGQSVFVLLASPNDDLLQEQNYLDSGFFICSHEWVCSSSIRLQVFRWQPVFECPFRMCSKTCPFGDVCLKFGSFIPMQVFSNPGKFHGLEYCNVLGIEDLGTVLPLKLERTKMDKSEHENTAF